MTRLTVRELSVRFGDHAVLVDLELDLAAGQIVGVTGGSAVGKTTLVHVLAGRLAPTSGRVELEVRGERDGVAVVPQQLDLVRILTAIENVGVTAVGALTGTGPDGPSAARTAARTALVAVGLEESADQLPDELSGGQRQRVAVARAVARRPALLLADEPTTELDPDNRARILGVLRDEATAGAAVLVTTNEPETLNACDVAYELVDGSLHDVAPPSTGRHAAP